MNSESETKREPGGKRETGAGRKPDPMYYYRDSGIQEKHGEIPLWLIAVVVILFIWGIYYLVAFWTPPPS